MGRSQRKLSASSLSGFDQVFGRHRGSLHGNILVMAQPTAEARAYAQRLRVQMDVGNLAPTLEMLSSCGNTPKAPLVRQLRIHLAQVFQAEHMEEQSDDYRSFLSLAGMRTRNWADEIVSDKHQTELSTMHIWPKGATHGERHLRGQSLINLACGRSMSPADVNRLVSRGAWNKPIYTALDGRNWHHQRCPECLPHASFYEDCQDEPEALSLLRQEAQQEWQASSVEKIERQLALHMKKSTMPSDVYLRADVERLSRKQLVRIIAAEHAANNERALSAVLGYPSDLPQLPNAEQWRKLLQVVAPTARNRKRYHSASRGMRGQDIHEQFSSSVLDFVKSLNSGQHTS